MMSCIASLLYLLPYGTSEQRPPSHFAEMPAPDRPMAGAFATLRPIDTARVIGLLGQPITVHLAPTRSGAGISAKYLLV
jgi:hypothetical protein